MEAATMKRGCSVKSAAGHGRAMETANRTTRYIAASGICATPARMTEPRTTVPSVRITPAAEPSRTMEPWAGSDEDATDEPVGAVVAVRSASVRGISVVSVRTNRGSANCDPDRPHSDSHAHLRLRVRQWNHQHRQHRNIFQVTHNHLPLPVPITSFGSGRAFQIL